MGLSTMTGTLGQTEPNQGIRVGGTGTIVVPAGQRILHEVSNTFGEHHSYLIPVVPSADGTIRQACSRASTARTDQPRR